MNTLVKVTLADQAHRELRARIVSGRLRGGERLLPNELAADLGISPTPVKEACLKLEADGLVVNSSRRGMVVRDFTVEDVEELYAARMLLEKGAVEVAFDAGQLNETLHAQLVESLAQHRAFAKGSTLDELSKALFSIAASMQRSFPPLAFRSFPARMNVFSTRPTRCSCRSSAITHAPSKNTRISPTPSPPAARSRSSMRFGGIWSAAGRTRCGKCVC